MLKALAQRMPAIAPDGQVSRLRSNFVNGIKHMPVRFWPVPTCESSTVANLARFQ